MTDLLTSIRFRPETAQEGLPPSVQSFLIQSEQRVIEHCERLLRAQDLAAEHHHRLKGILGVAEAELQRLVA